MSHGLNMAYLSDTLSYYHFTDITKIDLGKTFRKILKSFRVSPFGCSFTHSHYLHFIKNSQVNIHFTSSEFRCLIVMKNLIREGP